MSDFVDELGNNWSLRIDINAIRKVRSKRGIDLAKVISSQDELNRLVDDPCMWVDVIWDLIEEQAKSKSVTEEMFAHGLLGDAIERATSALLQAIVDFFPTSRREILQRLLMKVKQMEATKLQKVSEAVDSLTFGD